MQVKIINTYNIFRISDKKQDEKDPKVTTYGFNLPINRDKRTDKLIGLKCIYRGEKEIIEGKAIKDIEGNGACEIGKDGRTYNVLFIKEFTLTEPKPIEPKPAKKEVVGDKKVLKAIEHYKELGNTNPTSAEIKAYVDSLEAKPTEAKEEKKENQDE